MAKREFTITAGPEGLNRDEVVQALVDAEAIMHREGGAFVVASTRVKVDNPDGFTREQIPHVFETVGYVFRHVYTPHIDMTAQREPSEAELAEHFEQEPGETIDELDEAEEIPPGLEEETTALENALDGLDVGSPTA